MTLKELGTASLVTLGIAAAYIGGKWTDDPGDVERYPNPVEGAIVKEAYSDEVTLSNVMTKWKDTAVTEEQIVKVGTGEFRDTVYVDPITGKSQEGTYEIKKDSTVFVEMPVKYLDTLSADTAVSAAQPRERDLPVLAEGCVRICRIFDMDADSTMRFVREISYKPTPQIRDRYKNVQVNVYMTVQSEPEKE